MPYDRFYYGTIQRIQWKNICSNFIWFLKKKPITPIDFYISKFEYSNKSSVVRVKGLEPPRRKALDPKSSASANFATLAIMVSQEGFEPPTPALEGRCSIQLSYWDDLFPFENKSIISQKVKVFNSFYNTFINFFIIHFKNNLFYIIIIPYW